MVGGLAHLCRPEITRYRSSAARSSPSDAPNASELPLFAKLACFIAQLNHSCALLALCRIDPALTSISIGRSLLCQKTDAPHRLQNSRYTPGDLMDYRMVPRLSFSDDRSVWKIFDLGTKAQD